jgi:hypothetical protein
MLHHIKPEEIMTAYCIVHSVENHKKQRAYVSTVSSSFGFARYLFSVETGGDPRGCEPR